MRKLNCSHLLALLFAVVLTGSLFAEVDNAKKQEIIDATSDAVLIQAIQAPGDDADAIFMKMLACKRLAVIGTPQAVPALEAMLPNEKLNHAARYALEEMPCPEAAQALLRGVKNLDGKACVGCIQSVGFVKPAEAVAVLKEKYAGCKCPKIRKAIYAAMGMIASDESIAFLLDRMAKPAEEDVHVQMGLGDAILDAAENLEKAGDYAKAVEIYDACVNPSFPVFLQKAASYHAILARKNHAGELLVSKMFSPKECCFTGGLKTIREFSAADGETITKALLEILDKLPKDRQSLVLMALAGRKDAASQKLVFPVLLAKVADPETRVAAVRGLINLGGLDAMKTFEACAAYAEEADAETVKYGIQMFAALPEGPVDAKLMEILKTTDFSMWKPELAVAFFKVVELRRIAAAGPEIVRVANTEGLDGTIRYAALDALADIVTLDRLDLLVDALANEKDDQKASWILRSACTRLPREDCAAQVSELFLKSKSTEDQLKMLTLLKQIGGPTALATVEKACWIEGTMDSATQVLGSWNSPDDVEAVAAASLKLAKEAPEHYAIRGIRSYIRIPRQFDIPNEKKFAMCKIAFETAKRHSEKKLIFEVFKRVIEVASAKEAMSYAENPAFREDACAACVAIAQKFQGQSSAMVALLKKVQEISQNEQLKKDAQNVIDRLDAFAKACPLEIISARYGAEKTWKDVTEIVSSHFTGKAGLGISAGNALFGDVYPGHVKTTEIVVKFRDSGETRTVIFKENEAVVLPVK